MSKFIVSYQKKDKPSGIRDFLVNESSITFEDVLLNYTLADLFERNYSHPFDLLWLNKHVFIKRINANALLSKYNVLLYKMNSTSELIADYIVEIECVENDGSVDVLLQEQELHEPPHMIL